MQPIIRKLTGTDVDVLNTLPPKDWRFNYADFLNTYYGQPYFYAITLCLNDKIIGTGNAFFSRKTGWLANIIVDLEYRGNGFGKSITQHLIDFLFEKGCETLLLIATDKGYPVYKSLGFIDDVQYQTYETFESPNFDISPSIQPLTKALYSEVLKLDQETNDEDRRHLIPSMKAYGMPLLSDREAWDGFYLPNFGRGLVIARNQHAGIELLKLKHNTVGMRTVVPISNLPAISFFETNSINKLYPCTRMYLGKPNNWKPQQLYSYGMGYFG